MKPAVKSAGAAAQQAQQAQQAAAAEQEAEEEEGEDGEADEGSEWETASEEEMQTDQKVRHALVCYWLIGSLQMCGPHVPYVPQCKLRSFQPQSSRHVCSQPCAHACTPIRKCSMSSLP